MGLLIPRSQVRALSGPYAADLVARPRILPRKRPRGGLDEALLEVRGEPRQRERDHEEDHRDRAEDLEGMVLADADRDIGGQALVLQLSGLEELDAADHGRERRV